MLTGFYVADLAKRGKEKQARNYLAGIHQANGMACGNIEWCFPEFIHGQKLIPSGTQQQGWSAAAAIIGTHCLEGQELFRIDHE
jgi:glycogen debranching enzyme